MNRRAWIAVLLLALTAGVWGVAGEPPSCPPDSSCFLQRVGPVGGWCPYGGGLLRWWNPHCFPRCGGPDDYCRKDLPAVCWPPYPPWYIWGPSAPRPPETIPPPCGSLLSQVREIAVGLFATPTVLPLPGGEKRP